MNTASNFSLQSTPRVLNRIVFRRIRQQKNQSLQVFFCDLIQDFFFVKRRVVHDDDDDDALLGSVFNNVFSKQSSNKTPFIVPSHLKGAINLPADNAATSLIRLCRLPLMRMLTRFLRLLRAYWRYICVWRPVSSIYNI